MKDLCEDLLHHGHIGKQRTEHDAHRQGIPERFAIAEHQARRLHDVTAVERHAVLRMQRLGQSQQRP